MNQPMGYESELLMTMTSAMLTEKNDRGAIWGTVARAWTGTDKESWAPLLRLSMIPSPL